MKASEEAALRRALAEIGRKGGKAGTGEAKRRSHEHYVKAGRARWAKAKRGGKVVGVLAAVLLGTLAGRAEAADEGWLALADNVSVQPATVHFGARSISVVTESRSDGKVAFYIDRISYAACARGYGQLIGADLQGHTLGPGIDVALGGDSVGSIVATWLCGVKSDIDRAIARVKSSGGR